MYPGTIATLTRSARAVVGALGVAALGVCLVGCDGAPTTYKALVDLVTGGLDCYNLYDVCVDLCGEPPACEDACVRRYDACSDRCSDIGPADARYDCEDVCDEAKDRCLSDCKVDTTACKDACAEARKKC